MSILKTLVLSLACVGLGIFLSTHEFAGKTAVERLERGWKQNVPDDALKKVKDGAMETVDGVKKKLSLADEKPVEHHSVEDKDALNKLIATRARR